VQAANRAANPGCKPQSAKFKVQSKNEKRKKPNAQNWKSETKKLKNTRVAKLRSFCSLLCVTGISKYITTTRRSVALYILLYQLQL